MKITKKFGAFEYRGSFRDYQRHLLRRIEDHMDESKINVVVPPGSGKVVMGLEILRRLGHSCLILSASEAQQREWGSAFVAEFASAAERAEAEQCVSYDVEAPSLITSMTYRKLTEIVMAHKRQEESAKRAEEIGEEFRGDEDVLDLIHWVQENGIGTILLDDAHHLTEKWQTALEMFLGVLGAEVQTVSVTSVPPYDLHAEDWERYITVCGEITDEICVPELVKGQVLCPHDDYVYFNYPTEDEAAGIRGYRLRADAAVAEAAGLGFMSELNRRLTKLFNKRVEYLYNHRSAIVGILTLLSEHGYTINVKLYRHLTGSIRAEALTLDAAQTAFNFLLESQTILHDGEKEQLLHVFERERVLHHGRVELSMTDKIRHTLVLSAGKLQSIAAITDAESRHLGMELREIVLTDPMEDGDMARIGSEAQPARVSMVSVLETLRHHSPLLPVGCVSGSAVILPDTLEQAVREHGVIGSRLRVEPIGYTRYARFRFEREEDILPTVSYLFKEGFIRVLVGSAESLLSLRDDVYINTFIPASFGATFTETNLIRGTVIRADRENEQKAANIWHLATVENDYALSEYPSLKLASRLAENDADIQSVDYHAMIYRFECYMGPCESTGELENGMARLEVIKPPYDAAGLKGINGTMLEKAEKRDKLSGIWRDAMMENTRPISEVRVSDDCKVPVLTPANLILLVLAVAGILLGLYFLPTMLMFTYLAFVATPDILWIVIILLIINIFALIWGIVFVLYMLPLLINHLFVTVSVRSLCRVLLKTMKDLKMIRRDADLVMENLSDRTGMRIYLDNCSHAEQVDFQKAVAEMLSPIENPRYIMVRAGWFGRLLWKWSFACPSVIARNDISVKLFAKHLRMSMGIMKFQYTRRDPGRKYLIFARNHAYLNELEAKCEKRLHVLKHDRM